MVVRHRLCFSPFVARRKENSAMSQVLQHVEKVAAPEPTPEPAPEPAKLPFSPSELEAMHADDKAAATVSASVVIAIALLGLALYAFIFFWVLAYPNY